MNSADTVLTPEENVPASVQKRQRVFMRFVTIRREKKRYVAEFRGSEKSLPTARIGIDKELFEEFLKGTGFYKFDLKEFKGDKKSVVEIYATEQDMFFELAMIYAFLLRVLKKEDRKRLNGKITETLFRLHMHELIFWNHHFTNAKDRYEQDRIARAFLTLYNIR